MSNSTILAYSATGRLVRLDLFGNAHPAKGDKPPVTLGLFEHAAERAALASGRPLSQELGELRSPQRLCIDCGGPVGFRPSRLCDPCAEKAWGYADEAGL
jgi:hypothetical protein